MGCVNDKYKVELSPKLRQKVLGIFQKIDVDGSKAIDKEETAKYWKSNFAKLNTNELFKAVDFDNSGQITEDEWLAFWQIVKKSGHTEKEINEELDNLLEGKAWVKFTKVEEYLKNEQIHKTQNIEKIIDKERKKLDPEELPKDYIHDNNIVIAQIKEDRDLKNVHNRNY